MRSGVEGVEMEKREEVGVSLWVIEIGSSPQVSLVLKGVEEEISHPVGVGEEETAVVDVTKISRMRVILWGGLDATKSRRDDQVVVIATVQVE